MSEKIVLYVTEADDEKKRVFRKYFRDKMPYYQTMARRGGFTIGFGFQTAFDHEQKRVVIGLEQLEQLDVLDDRQILDFLVQHELGHYTELYTDPQGYRAMIDEMKNRKWGVRIFRFYNSFMDIFANRLSARRSDLFCGKRPGIFSEKIERLYREKLFSREEMAEMAVRGLCPLAEQFSVYLLNCGMGVGDDLYEVLAPEIKEIIDRGLRFAGRKMEFEQFIETFLTPKPDQRQKVRETITKRKKIIDQFILPIYKKLLEEDEKRDRARKSRQDEGEEDSEDRDAFDDRDRRDGESRKQMEIWEEVLTDAEEKQVQAAEEARKTSRDKANERRRGQLHGEAASHKFRGDVEDFWRRLEANRQVIERMKALWSRICREAEDWTIRREGYFKTGKSLSIGEFIKTYGQILRQPEAVRVMERDILHREAQVTPRKFQITFLLDLSGSMSSNVDKVKDFLIAMTVSLANFNQESFNKKIVGQVSDETAAVLDLIGFNAVARDLLKTNDGGKTTGARTGKQITTEDIMFAYGHISADGGTNDAVALRLALDRLEESCRRDLDLPRKIKSGEEIQIVIELTDGDSAKESRAVVEKLKDLGVIVGGVKIGGEEQTFRDTFPDKEGKQIAEISELPAAMAKLLEGILSAGNSI